MSTLITALCWCGQDLPHGLTATMLYHAGRGERVVVPSFLLRDAVAVIKDHHSARAALTAAVKDMASMAEGGAARAHLDSAGIMQDHSGIYRECKAPWCVRNQERIAAARLIAGEGT